MEITKITANSITPKLNGVCGEFSVVFDDALCVHKILVVNGEKGLFVAFPNGGRIKQGSMDGRKHYLDLVHPTNNELRQHIQSKILDFYNNEVEML